jgi:3-methylcrotonyl-CoA carboxylase alpha subunit
LQVEHPVTEMITGHDLVEWQLRVAGGEPLTAMLPELQKSLSIDGHALEARVYAENPDAGFLPSIGRLVHFATPEHVAFARNADGEPFHRPAAVRIDSGVRAGDEITPYYDPMIAKLIVWGEDRSQAIARMHEALAEMHIVGVANNVDFLTRLFSNPSFSRGELDTGLIERERERLFAHDAREERVGAELLAFACARVLADDACREGNDPWSSTHGWRLNTTYTRALTFRSERGVHDVELEYTRGGYCFRHDGVDSPLAIAHADGTRLTIYLGGRALSADVVRQDDELHLFNRGRHRVLALVDVIALSAKHDTRAGRLTAPMPGKVIALNTQAGARVTQGTPLLVMEAMKMEHTIVAPTDGLVAELLYAVGDQVTEGAELVRFEAE